MNRKNNWAENQFNDYKRLTRICEAMKLWDGFEVESLFDNNGVIRTDHHILEDSSLIRITYINYFNNLLDLPFYRKKATKWLKKILEKKIYTISILKKSKN